MDKDQKVSVIMLEAMPDIYDRARRNMNVKLPKAPSADASLEEVENYEHAIDNYDDEVTEAVSSLTSGYSKELRAELDGLSDEEFEGRLIRAMENQICINFMNERFNEEIVWRSVYTDAKFSKSYFESYDDYIDLAEEVRNQLERGYKDLQMHRGELKN
jgi:hypothetical protein